MAQSSSRLLDAVIIGGGVSGNALASVLARAGKEVLVLERSSEYKDRVRGEYVQPWGVAEARRLGLHDALLRAGGIHHKRFVPYDETLEPEAAEAATVALDGFLPEVPGTMGIAHPVACEALAHEAEVRGAVIERGIEVVKVEFGASPSVTYRLGSQELTARCHLIIGAEGRESMVRREAGIALHATTPRLLGAGLLVADLRDWDEEVVTIGTEGDLVFFVLPQTARRARLYLMYPADQRARFSGPDAASSFLGSFRLASVPDSDRIAGARPAGPCAAFPMNDSWTETPVEPGLALIGDAAGYSDPHLGQGLSVALRDVRVLSELLIGSSDWSAADLMPYVIERSERMRRLRFCNDIATTLRGEFGDEARERRKRARERMQAEPELALWRYAAFAGPEMAPASAFTEHVRSSLLAN